MSCYSISFLSNATIEATTLQSLEQWFPNLFQSHHFHQMSDCHPHSKTVQLESSIVPLMCYIKFMCYNYQLTLAVARTLFRLQKWNYFSKIWQKTKIQQSELDNMWYQFPRNPKIRHLGREHQSELRYPTVDGFSRLTGFYLRQPYSASDYLGGHFDCPWNVLN